MLTLLNKLKCFESFRSTNFINLKFYSRHKTVSNSIISNYVRRQSTVLYSWGEGTDGQLGHAKYEMTTGVFGSFYIQEEPRKMIKSKKIETIAIGDSFTLGVTYEGELLGWGKGFLGDSNQSNEPVSFIPELKVKSASAGEKHCAIIDYDGQIHTWGYGGSWLGGGGFLGHGTTKSVKFPKMVEAFKSYGTKASMISCGLQHTVILTDDGEVLTCGVGEYGLLGTGNTLDALTPVTVDSLIKEDIIQIAAGYDHTLALTSKGLIYSWGRNNSGQLGHADSNFDMYSMEDFPRLIDAESIQGLENEELKGAGQWSGSTPLFSQIAAGNGISAALTSEGLLFVWGSGLSNQPKLIPGHLFENRKIIKIGCGGPSGKSVIVALTEDGRLWIFGESTSKLLGHKGKGGIGKQVTPLVVSSLCSKVASFSIGYGRHMFAFVNINEDI